MSYPIPTTKETKALLKFYAGFSRAPKHKARAQFEYMKSILERVSHAPGTREVRGAELG